MKIWCIRAKISAKFLPTIIGLCVALMVITLLRGAALAQGPIEVKEEFMISSISSVGGFGLQAISGDIEGFPHETEGQSSPQVRRGLAFA